MKAPDYITWSSFLTMVSVIFSAVVLMPLVYTGIADALVPWRDIVAEDMPLRTWVDEEKIKVQKRRHEERMAAARDAWLRGDPKAGAMIGRRRSDYEALGLPFPDENAPQFS